MTRRDFLLTGAAALILPAILPGAAKANPVPYTPALYRDLRGSDDVAVYLFWSSWSLTCGFQREALEAIKAANPAYRERLRFVNVDYDTMGKSRMAQALKVPRRSTILVLKGKREIARVVEETRPERIQALLDAAMAEAGPVVASNG